MLTIAILIGLYSYGVFFIGLLGFLTSEIVVSYTLALSLLFLFNIRKRIFLGGNLLSRFFLKLDKWGRFYLLLIAILALINLIGALGPETAFDALWYHLTLPKIYLSENRIFYIPGGLLYYSAMPKLVEMLYISALSFDSEILAKIIHFTFGILSLFMLYRLSRIYFSKKISLLVLLVFYSNLVVLWQSTTSYIDLGRTFFEVGSVFSFAKFIKTKNNKFLLLTAVLLGFAISTKLLSTLSLFIFTLLLLYQRVSFKSLLKFILVSLLIPSPWFAFSFLNTGNPFYPFLSEVYKLPQVFDPGDLLNFIHSQDPISPIYLIALPAFLIGFKKFGKNVKVLGYYSFLAFVFWLITPQIGGGRFIMPYLPAFSVLVGALINSLRNRMIKNYLIALVIIISLVSIAYRFAANLKYIPVITGSETKTKFLSKNLNFSFGDFYDTDEFFKNHIKAEDKVLIYGTHNLYYVNFPFIHESYLEPDDKYDYVMVQNSVLPQKFSSWKLIYENKETNVRLYTKN